ncbi:MAG TPA: hypothetical protein VN420_01145 [Candidatus Fimivivens sp.]|nr:hypothetical protein [Candidatus Fimivivens sp.]
MDMTALSEKDYTATRIEQVWMTGIAAYCLYHAIGIITVAGHHRDLIGNATEIGRVINTFYPVAVVLALLFSCAAYVVTLVASRRNRPVNIYAFFASWMLPLGGLILLHGVSDLDSSLTYPVGTRDFWFDWEIPSAALIKVTVAALCLCLGGVAGLISVWRAHELARSA